ncbi:HlyD family type I secretion periplasmic adaptor subunit [Luteithermobacter gelatinilyticus]|uniref:HlyD family type I secretion periplasmic adaptor subunit n=1 Tax=Luteithermobacter gelatinilyticus TaxID=2582913 RepID=UPI00143D6C03|nr:HlyD family type I secretion periplasmic adaptor subunit [Luteithermobacter gelatinilyticus]
MTKKDIHPQTAQTGPAGGPEMIHKSRKLARNLLLKATEAARAKKEKPTTYYTRFLSRAILLEEAGPPKAVISTIGIISFFVLSCILWAAVTKLDEASMAQGQIVPAASIQPVQHLEGGIVAEVLVEEGEMVKKGQTLLRMAPTQATSERGRMLARHAALSMQVERLKAFALDKTPDFSRFEATYPTLVRDQRDILQQQIRSRKAQEDVILAQIAERRNEWATLLEQEKNQRQALEIIAEELKMRQELTEKGLGSRLRLLEAQKEYNKTEGSLQETLTRKAGIKASITEAESNLVQLRANLRNDALIQMGNLSKELAEVTADLERLDDRVTRLNVKAPTDGIVKGLKYRSAGSVVPPGDVVAEVVPYTGKIQAEVRISPRDIGHVKVGDEVLVKVDTYNYARFGGVEGRLEKVSASSFMDEEGVTYFKGIVELPRNYVGTDPSSNRITPGMTVVADIKTGEKTLLQYLVKPINNALSTSFRER